MYIIIVCNFIIFSKKIVNLLKLSSQECLMRLHYIRTVVSP